MQSHVIELSQGAAEDIAARLHRLPPGVRVEVQALHDDWEAIVNRSALVFAAAADVDREYRGQLRSRSNTQPLRWE